MTKDEREKLVDTLGKLLHDAVRTSITRGAIYDNGENISNDAKGAWRAVADALVIMMVDKKEITNG